MHQELINPAETSVRLKQSDLRQKARRIELVILASMTPAILGLIILGAHDKENDQISKFVPGPANQVPVLVADEPKVEDQNSLALEKLNKMFEYMETSGSQSLKKAAGDFQYLLIGNLFYLDDRYGSGKVPKPFEVRLFGGFPTPDKSSWRIAMITSQLVGSEAELAFHFYQAVVLQKLLTEARNTGVELTEIEMARIDAKAWVETMNKAYCPLRSSVKIDHFERLCNEIQKANNTDIHYY